MVIPYPLKRSLEGLLTDGIVDSRFWPDTEISAVDLVAEYLPFNSVERKQDDHRHFGTSAPNRGFVAQIS